MEQRGLALLQLINSPQHNRILRLSYPKKDGPRTQFLVNSLDAVEALSCDFEFTVELLSTAENVALKDMHGKLLAVELVRLDGTQIDSTVAIRHAKVSPSGPWFGKDLSAK